MTVFLRSSVIPAQAGIQKVATLQLLILLLVLTGCDAPGTARLKELCETEGYPRVYEKVSAAGYYDDTRECGDAIRFLAGWNLEFVECKQTRDMPISLKKNGLYRISKVHQSSRLCDPDLMAEMEKRPFAYQKMHNLKMCFSVRVIDKPRGKYGLFRGNSKVQEMDNIFGSKIVTNSYYLKKIESGQLVAEDQSFQLYPMPGIKVSSFEKMLHCNTVNVRNRGISPLNKVDAYIEPLAGKQESNREIDHGRYRESIPSGTPG